MAKKQNYTSNDIEVLTDQQHVQKRLNMYAGSSKLNRFTLPNFNDSSQFSFSEIEKQ